MKKSEDNSVPAKQETVAPERILGLRAFSQEGNLGVAGKALDYKKGDWSADGQPVQHGMRLIADMTGGYRCVGKWYDGHPVDGTFQLASIAADERLPLRNELGDLDESKWEKGLDGQPRNPWVYGHRQILKGLDGGLYTFRTSSWGGKRAMQLLYGEFEREYRSHPGQYPIVELGQEKVHNKTFGMILEPRFKVVGWTNLDGPPAIEATADDPRTMQAEPSLADQLDDAIPF